MTIGDGIILTVLIFVVFLILFLNFKGRKKGRSSCHCAGCEKREFCQKYKEK